VNAEIDLCCVLSCVMKRNTTKLLGTFKQDVFKKWRENNAVDKNQSDNNTVNSTVRRFYLRKSERDA
jgi:hypothetical protein